MNISNPYRPFILTVVFATVIALTSCAGKSTEKESLAEKAVDHYATGMEKLSAKDYAGAETEFKKAVDLNKSAPDGYIGMALLRMHQEKYNDAMKQVRRALKRNDTSAGAYVVRGRIIAARKNGDNWLDDAVSAFTVALQYAPDSTEVYYYRGEAYLDAWRYTEAHEDYVSAASHDGVFKSQASTRMHLIDEIVKSAPRTAYGHRIVRREAVNREDLCVLLVQECGLLQLLGDMRPELFERLYTDDFQPQHGSVTRPLDVMSDKHSTFIEVLLPLHIMHLDIFPNGNFFPHRLVTRSVFSYIVQELMVLLLHDPTLATRYIGSESTITDVRADYYAYNSVRLCIDEGIMKYAVGTSFDPDGNLSGTDALGMLRRLEEAIR